MEEPRMEVRRVPVIDTGIGLAMGYRNDAELIEAAEAEREATNALLTPEALARAEDAEREFQRRLISGD